ncbi:hypothetical protein [Actinopolymorpha alba]|uniref:hypothetical protein n=1 Tax=Actinopolymorpha alba TaxID=533267 RepID=UPI00036FB1AD|nr:hypothetical protein [Actinopolymorpha alba]
MTKPASAGRADHAALTRSGNRRILIAGCAALLLLGLLAALVSGVVRAPRQGLDNPTLLVGLVGAVLAVATLRWWARRQSLPVGAVIASLLLPRQARIAWSTSKELAIPPGGRHAGEAPPLADELASAANAVDITTARHAATVDDPQDDLVTSTHPHP